MSAILHILKFKLIAFSKINFNFSFENISKNLGSFFVYSVFAIGAFFFSHASVKYLLEDMKIGLFLLHEFFSITLFIFFIAVNVGNIIVSYATLYKSQEVNFLFNKPIPPSSIFIIKFLDNFFYSSSTLVLILLSVLSGYAYYLGFSFFDILLLFLFNFVPFMLSAASLGIIILLLLVKLSTLLGIRIVIGALTFVYILSLYFFFNIVSPVDLVNQVMQYYPNVDLYFGNYLPDTLKLLPNHWLSTSMYWIARDNYTASLSSFYLQIITCIVLFASAILLGIKWYHKTWFYEFRLRKSNSKSDIDRRFSFKSNSKLGFAFESILKREFHNFFREPTQLFHAIVMLVLIFLFLSSVSSVIKLEDVTVFLQTIIYLAVFIFNTFLVATLALRFVFPLISLEGKTFWKIKSAPVSTLQIFRMKLIPYLIIIISIALLLNFVVNIQFDFILFLISSVITIAVSVSLILLNFSLGGLFANYTEKNPIRIASSQGASLSFLISLFIMAALIAVLYIPTQAFFECRMKYAISSYDNLIYAAAVVIFVSIFISFISHKIVQRTLKTDF